MAGERQSGIYFDLEQTGKKSLMYVGGLNNFKKLATNSLNTSA